MSLSEVYSLVGMVCGLVGLIISFICLSFVGECVDSTDKQVETIRKFVMKKRRDK